MRENFAYNYVTYKSSYHCNGISFLITGNSNMMVVDSFVCTGTSMGFRPQAMKSHPTKDCPSMSNLQVTIMEVSLA